MMREFRLIVTGSREYDDHLSLRTALNQKLGMMPRDTLLVVVHGGHPNPDLSTKADQIAQEWALERMEEGMAVDQEPWPADWEGPCRGTCEPGHRQLVRGVLLCPAAGPYRNDAMCARGADRGLAALKVGTRSTGSKDCLNAMLRHGIDFDLVIQGAGRGLPRELIELGRLGQGRPAAI